MCLCVPKKQFTKIADSMRRDFAGQRQQECVPGSVIDQHQVFLCSLRGAKVSE